MSFTGLTIQGGIHPCYPFHQRFRACMAEELVPGKMCQSQVEDYLECFQKNKQYALNYKVHQELQKYKILSIPRYDYDSDSFLADDSMPDADLFFRKEQQA